jgi:hypothetical protein
MHSKIYITASIALFQPPHVSHFYLSKPRGLSVKSLKEGWNCWFGPSLRKLSIKSVVARVY